MNLARRKSTYRDLEVWQRACDLVVEVYGLTADYPKQEVYGLTSQIRRCAASVPANIAEGRDRHSDRDFVRFLRVAAGSLAELETFLELSRRLGFAEADELACIEEKAAEVGRMLHGLIAAIRGAAGG
jgi:four helix bundle protein